MKKNIHDTFYNLCRTYRSIIYGANLARGHFPGRRHYIIRPGADSLFRSFDDTSGIYAGRHPWAFPRLSDIQYSRGVHGLGRRAAGYNIRIARHIARRISVLSSAQ